MSSKVHLRQRLNKDKISLYLEIYSGYTLNKNGGTKAKRKRQTLDYFLYANPKTPTQKSHNKDSLRKAEAIRSEMDKEILNGKYGFKSNSGGKINFIEYFRKLTEDRLSSTGNYGNWDSVLKHLIKFSGESLYFDSIDGKYCEGFKIYLQTTKTKSEKNLSSNSISSYFNKFRAALNQAVNDEIILVSPARNTSIPKAIESKREYLTEDELKNLINAECRYDILKRAFLFSCYTGLRWSDINKLVWSEVRKEGEKWRVVFHQKKTKGLQYHPIPNKALELMGEHKAQDEKVFVGLRYSAYMNTALSQWVLRAGITKTITFHCGRHTFATMLLNKRIDIFTVSKLLGHSEIKTTQIYANIIDQTKIDAMDVIDNLDFDE